LSFDPRVAAAAEAADAMLADSSAIAALIQGQPGE
jgi:hypothetical protein